MSYKSPLKLRTATAKIVVIYVLFGLAWIYGSDTILGWLVHDPVVMVKIAVIKGSLFIVCTATLLYFLINRFVQHLAAADSAKIESLKNYQAIFNATNEAIFVHDAQSGCILDVNDRMLEIYGYKRDEALTVDIGQLSEGTHPYTQEEAAECVRKAMAEGPQVFEWLCRRKTGELFWTEVSLRRITINDFDRVIAVVRDISERKQMDDALRKSEERHRSILNTAIDGFWLTDKQGRLLEVNEAYSQMSGYGMQELLHMSIPDLEAIETPDDTAEHLKIIIVQGEARFETRHRRKNETLFDVEVSVKYQTTDGGQFVVFLHDITESKRKENCMAFLAQAITIPAGEDFFHRLARYLAESLEMDFICIDILEPGNLSARTVAIFFDGAFEDNISYTLKDTPCGEVVDKEVCCYKEAVRHHFPGDVVLQDMKAESYVGTILWGSNGKQIGLIAAISRKPLVNHEHAEEILRMVSGRAAAELERNIYEDERLTLERQLLHAQKLESLGVLAGGIAHDFNNILTSIVGNADLALMKMSPESPSIDNLHRIESAAAKAADLAKQMLAYSGKGMFVVSNLDLNRLLEEMLHMLEVSISKKAVLRLNLTPDLPSIEADATQMRQILMNLVINASEAIGDKSGVIAINTGCMDCDKKYLKAVWLDENIKEGLFVYLEIADTGCGMDKHTLTKIFDPFFTTKFTGRGLGMAAVLGIVRGHKGAIKVYSEPGKGTTFKVLLPASNKPAEIFNHDSHTDDWQGSGNVLLVDDEETVRGIGKEMLHELGFTTITANDGREAIEIFKQTPDIAFVILDLTMPHLDGEQCFRELRRLKPDVKVIMSSGFSEYEVTQKFVGKGLAGFIQKPYKFSVLKAALKKI